MCLRPTAPEIDAHPAEPSPSARIRTSRICTGRRLNPQVAPPPLKVGTMSIAVQNTKGGSMPTQPGDRDETHRAIVADLASVIEHVRKSRRLIEQAVASEAAIEEPAADNVIVLDDVAPRYARAEAALRACDVGLSLALRLMQGPSGE